MNKFLLTSASLLASTTVVQAQSIIDAIEITGNKRLPQELVESYLPYSEGMTYTSGLKKKIIKSLYSTKQFSDIKVTFDPAFGKLLIEVKENPQVNKVAFEDNEEIADSVLKKIISIKSRSVFTGAKVADDIKAIKPSELAELMADDKLVYDGRRYFSKDEVKELQSLGVCYRGVGRSFE